MSDIDNNTSYDFKKLGDEQYKNGNYTAAIEYFEKHIEKNPQDALIYNMIGYLYKRIDEDENIDKQIKYFEKALEIRPDFRSATRNLAYAYYRMRKYEEAIKFYRNLLKLDPLADDYCAYACIMLQLGDFKEGWKYYEYRFLKKYGRTDYPAIDKPRWEGQTIPDKTLLVQYEQGFGDSIQFLRYLQLLKPFVKKIIFRVQDELVDLFRINVNGIEIAENSTSFEDLSFDYHIPLMSIPSVINTSIENIPSPEGYINAEKNKVEAYKKEFFDNDCFKIGISWHGMPTGNRDRDVPLTHFYNLSKLNNVKIYSFQKGPGEKQLEKLPLGIEIINMGKIFNNFSDTAAAMANLDLFITSDNSSFNLAGAMGKRTFVLLNKDSEWRWFLDEDSTPWYNSVKIFKKQKKNESWDLLMQRVIDNLSN